MARTQGQMPVEGKHFGDFGYRELEQLEDRQLLYGIYRQIRILVITTWVLIAVGIVAGAIYAVIIAGAVEESGGL